MKRLIFLLTLCLLLPLPQEASAKNTGRAMVRLADEFRHEDGVEVTDLGRIALSLMRAAAKASASSRDEKAVLAAFTGITRLVVVDCEDAPDEVRKDFAERARKLLRKEEILLEAKDRGDLIRIYGSLSETGEEIRDIIIFNEGGGGLVCAFGTVPTSFLERVKRKAKR